MKFLIVFSALAALTAAKPGVLAGLGYAAGHQNAYGYTAYSASVPAAVATPVAYSSVVSTPVVAHSAPVVAHSAPVVSHSTSVVAHSTPVVAHAAPVVAHAAPVVAHAAPVVAHAAPVVAHATPVVAGIKSQYHAQDALGQASYGHSEPFQAHSAVQDAHGNKIGSFSYVAPNGQVVKTHYVADALGYRVASNALPVGPGPVHDTPEVVAARAAHLAAFHHRARRGIAAVAVGHTPAATAPLAHAAVVAPAAVSYASPISAVAPIAYSAPLASSYSYSAPVYSHGLTTVVSAPAVSYVH